MAMPVGEDSWIDFVDQQLREATNLAARVKVVEQFRRAVFAEPGSLKVWIAYCEYFWSLHTDCQHGSDAGWSREDQRFGRETFSLDAALHLWQDGYEAVRYRLNDSHELWNRWISLEMEQLAKTRTEQGVRRITHLFANRLAIPHATWDATSQMFSSFLSEYNRNAYESEMHRITEIAADAKGRYELRDRFEMDLTAAARSGNAETHRTALAKYLEWEMNECKFKRNDVLSVEICLGLYSRALTGIFASDETTWINYVVFLSSTRSDIASGRVKNAEAMTRVLPNMLDTLQRAVHHVPWSGTVWARYILVGEEAGLSFADMERIKHAATSSSQLDRDSMTGVIDMYSAWCGYLKRTAMNPSASEEAVDLADIGLSAALEDVQHWGKRRYGDAYKGDPNYRLEKIYIQYLTEKRETPDEARSMWERMSRNDLHANSYDFWLHYYLWEMVDFSFSKTKRRSPTPNTAPQALRVPALATQVFVRALQQRTMDWPERVMEVYVQHCNDYETPDTLRKALDTVYKTKIAVAKRREREAAAAQAAYAAQVELQQPTPDEPMQGVERESPSGKRKREGSIGEDAESSNKKAKGYFAEASAPDKKDESDTQALKRDRENTSVFVTGLPTETTQTKTRQYFREYGHINNIDFKKSETDITALIEFRAPEEAQSALLRDGKFFGQQQIAVRAATGCTLFVTNYPPASDEHYIRGLFGGKSGDEIFTIRFPSLKFNTKRRFCYVTFYNQDAATKATKRLDGKLLEGKYKLQAMYSAPAARQQRSGAQAEGRELHVLNLHPDVGEEDLKRMFDKHGTVQSTRVLRNSGGVSHGAAFVVMETKEQARIAAEALDKFAFRGRVITVETSTPKNFKTTATTRGSTASPGPASDAGSPSSVASSTQPHIPPAELAARQIAVLGIPDTVTDARLRTALEPLCGPNTTIAKLVLHPGRGGAILEFGDAAAAGRASLALEGAELEPGLKLRVGTPTELFAKTTHPNDVSKQIPAAGRKATSSLMPPPTAIKRPQKLGGRGGRPGLGFTGGVAKKTNEASKETTAPAANGTEQEGADEAPPATKKSNADFKAMFLGGSGNKTGKSGNDEPTNAAAKTEG